MSDFSFTTLLNTLYQSKTITPTYNIPQIIYTILLIGKEHKGIGRYKIKNHINLGEGATKTLLTRLREAEIIHLENEHSRQRGHVLTTSGKKINHKLLHIMSYPQALKNEGNSYVIGEIAYYTRVKKQYCSPDLHLGITQRDEAIKIGGMGASCLRFDGQRLIFPEQTEEKFYPTIDQIDLSILEEGDIIIIGGGKTKKTAILATIAAAYSIFTGKF
jgi:hypothetical protein